MFFRIFQFRSSVKATPINKSLNLNKIRIESSLEINQRHEFNSEASKMVYEVPCTHNVCRSCSDFHYALNIKMHFHVTRRAKAAEQSMARNVSNVSHAENTLYSYQEIIFLFTSWGYEYKFLKNSNS